MPAPTTNPGPVASWITAAQWAGAAGRRFGHARLLTPHGWLTPEDALRRASLPSNKPESRQHLRGRAGALIETAVKDARRAVRARRLRTSAIEGASAFRSVRLIWQYHYLFENSGSLLARQLGVPLIQRVNAPQVWEAKRWGVPRPLWGGILEKVAEKPQLDAADLVACVSDEVAEVIRSKFGVTKVVVAPNGVDPDRFSPSVEGIDVRRRFGLQGKFVVGWTGSFHPFHGVDLVLKAATKLRTRIPNLALLLVGDGQTRDSLKSLAQSLELECAVFAGTVPMREVPEHIAAMDVAVLPAASNSGFHYSPVKLLEYMSSGKPVVAASVGQVENIIRDRVNGRLTTPGDATELAATIEQIFLDPSRSRELGIAARNTIEEGWTWDQQLEKVLRAL